MRKAIDIVLKIILSLILILPILGLLRVFPPPTPDLYNTLEAFEFIQTLEEVRYITIIMVVVHVIVLVCMWTGRMALAALLILPITVNVVAFHLVLDGGLHKAGAIPGNVMLLLNAYFLWQQRSRYRALFDKHA
jgi:Na+/H+ antiporter NhaC